MVSQCSLRGARVGAGMLASTMLTASAIAGTTTNNLHVTATVVNSCTINSATAVAFGTYDPVAANSAAAGTDRVSSNGVLTISCSQSSMTSIALGQGSNPAMGSTDAAPLRQMKSGSFALRYALYQDEGHTTAWGNTPGTGVQRVSAGGAESITVYGVVPRGQTVPAGAYTDVVVITVTF